VRRSESRKKLQNYDRVKQKPIHLELVPHHCIRVCLVANVRHFSKLKLNNAQRLGDCVPVSGRSECGARKIGGLDISRLTYSLIYVL
jgi:hypothetical protein